MPHPTWTGCCLGAILLAQGWLAAAGQAAEIPARVDFNRDVRSLLSDKCFRCHGPDAAHRDADLRLDRRDDAIGKGQGPGAIVPRDSAESELFRRITAGADERMPPPDSGLELSPRDIEILKRWIDQGAEYQLHWSFRAPTAHALPPVSDTGWPRNEIDHFVLAALERQNLYPSPAASRETLLRRVTLDLTGLPPTVAEIDAFLADNSPDAYERVVDRLLASPHYGERMSLDWLDAARYADTNGYFTDAERSAWPWRDWVIQAFNANMPFDQFTIEQLAGDLLPKPTLAQKIATGFNRNHMANNETGIIEEEFRTSYVADRVDTTSTVWLGLTVGCARCHDHKYDPISQREYYELFAFFNTIPESGIIKDVAPRSASPAISLPTEAQEQQLAKLRAERDRCQARLKELRPALDEALAQWEPMALASLPPNTTDDAMAHFDFNDRGEDQGPKRHETSIVGTLRYEPGVKGPAAVFDSTQYVEFEAAAGPRLDAPFSLALWIKPGGSSAGCVISKMDVTAESRGLEIVWYKSEPRINLVHAWGHDALEITAKTRFPTSRWSHLAISYDGSAKAAGLKVYVDGRASPVEVRRDSLTGSAASSEPWRIAWKGTGMGFEGGLDEVRFYERPLADDEVRALYWREMLEGATQTAAADRTKQQTDQFETYYVDRYGSDELRQLRKRLSDLGGEIGDVSSAILSTSVMQEMDKPRATHVLLRGQYDQLGEQVRPSVPASLGEMPAGTPPNRLGLARWLVSPDHPLTARVAVNRYWQQVFGDGLVRTPGDFGLQGEPPTHPQLLDWLAVRFVESGWDVKAMMKLLVTSATYRQSSNFTSQLLENDPDNRLLARGPRYRLPAELIRDQALAAGGLLARRIGGPSVKPYQPPGLWEAVSYDGNQSYQADHGESLYRRGLYTFWKRQAPPPDMLTLDAPTREVCQVRRARTNTPLQALLLLNDVAYVEAARALAARVLSECDGDVDERVAYGFRIATGRRPHEVELAALAKFYERQLVVFRASPKSAAALLKTGESPVDPALDTSELAAWTMVSNVLLNLDEVVTQH